MVIHNRSVMVFIFFPLIHCFHLDCPVPFAIIFGGTDLNEHKKDKEKFEAMSKVVVKARYIFTFTASELPLNPLSPKTDQHQISPGNINAL